MPIPPEIWKEPKNAFSRRFLRQCSRRDGEPDTAAEAYNSVAWRRVPHPRLGYALVHPADGPDQPPVATFLARHHALLAQAVLPFLGRDSLWRLGTDGQADGHPLRVEGAHAGYFQIFNDNVVPYLVGADLFTRNPRSLAFLLEATSPVALEHAGRYLERALRGREEGGDGE